MTINSGERQAIKLTAQTDTMEDYLETQVPPVPQDVSGRFVVVQDSARKDQPAELLTVNDKGKAIHFVPDENSQTGWNHIQIPMPGQSAPVTALRGFYRGGLLYAFIHYAVSKKTASTDTTPERGSISRVVPMVRDKDGKWSKLDLSNELLNVLTQVRQLDVHVDNDGKPYLYGLSLNYSPESFFIVTQNTRGQWKVVHLEDASDYSAYRLVAGLGDQQMSVLRISGSILHYRAGSLQVRGRRTRLVYGPDPWKYADLRHKDLKLDQIIPFQKRHKGLDFLVLSSQQHLDHVILSPGRRPTVKLLSGGSDSPKGIASVSLSLDGAGLYTIFAVVKNNQRLWVLRQQKNGKKVTIDYHPWSEVGDTYSAIAAPISMTNGAEFFAVDLDRRLLHAHQPSNSECDVWQRTIIESPKTTGDTQRCTTHNLELTALDEQEQPLADAVIQVSADRVTSVYVNGLSYRVGPKPLPPVALKSNSNGQLSLRVPCRRQVGAGEGQSTGLTAPVITARVSPTGRRAFERAYAPDLAFYKRMANLDKLHPMTPDKLKQKGLLPDKFDPDQAKVVAASVQQVAKNMVLRFAHQDQELATFAATPFAEKSWQFNFQGSKALQGNGVHVRKLSANQFENIYSKAPKGIERALGDLFRWIANTASAIVKVAFRVTASVIELVIQTAKGIQRFILDAAAQAAEFMVGIFKSLAELAGKIKDAAAALIQMFEALLSFEDILITKDVLKVGFDSFMESLEKSLSHGIPEYLNAKFLVAKQNLDQSFTQARQSLEGKSLNQIAFQNGGGHSPDDNQYGKALPAHGVRGGFIGQHTINALESSEFSLKLPKLSSQDQRKLDGILAELEKIYKDNGLEARAKLLHEDLRTIFEKPENLLTESLKLLLNMLHGVLELALNIANVVINLILKLLGKALGLLRQLYSQKISIPVVSALYKETMKSDLNLLDLSLLIVAAPGTILYKIIKGVMNPGQAVKRPFERKQIPEIRTMFGKLGDLRQIIEGPKTTKKMNAKAHKSLKSIMLTLGIINGCALFLFNYFEMGTDMLAAAKASVPYIGAIACLIGVVMFALTVPIPILLKNGKKRTTAEHYTVAVWFCRLIPLGLNCLIAAVSGGSKALKGIPISGPVMTAIFGAIMAAASVVAIVLQSVEKNIAALLAAIGSFCAGCADIARVFIPVISAKPPWTYIAALILFGVGRLTGVTRSGLAIGSAIAAFAA